MKALMCDFLDLGAQRHGCRFKLCHTLVKMDILLHKMAINRESEVYVQLYIYGKKYHKGWSIYQGY